jgi:hypothetical protein
VAMEGDMSKPYWRLSELQLRLLLVLKDMDPGDHAALRPCGKDLARILETPLWAVDGALDTLKMRKLVTQLPNGLRAEVDQ